MAAVAAERINQAIDPERSIDQAIADYRRLGYSEAWITRRIKTIEIRKGLTDEWKRGGVTKENLRDNMTNMELLLNSLAEEAAARCVASKQRSRPGSAEAKRTAGSGIPPDRGMSRKRQGLRRNKGGEADHDSSWGVKRKMLAAASNFS